MPDIDFKINLPETIPNQPLKDVEQSLVNATATFSATPPDLGPVKFKLSASANASVEAFNEPSDKDKDAILVAPIESDVDSSGAVKLPPQIPLTNNLGWLKYRFQGTGSASVAGTVAPVEFKIDASKSVVFADYRVHDRNQNTKAAITQDIPNLRFIGNPDDAFKLAENEALYYQVRGEFSAGVTLSWSDVITASVAQIAKILPKNQLLKIEIAPSASVNFKVGIWDDFQLVLTKASATKVRVALKKSNASEIGLTAELKVVVKFADEAQVQEMLDKLYEATFGQTLDKILQILNAPTAQLNKLIANLNSPLKEIAESIIGKLDLANIVPTLKDLKEKLESFQKTIKDTLKSIAKAKVEAGFKYEYLRTKTSDTLLVIQLDKPTFKRFHADLMVCEYIDLLEWARSNESAVEKYLNQKTLKRTQAWGFTLSFMKWNISGKDHKELKEVVQEDLQGNQRIAYRGLRGYNSKTIDKLSWAVDFKAEMNSFVKNPTTCDFEFGLNLKTTAEGKMNAGDIRRYLDDALIWQILTVKNSQEIIETISNAGLLNKNALISVELSFDQKSLSKLLPIIATADSKSYFSNAFAMAMPFNSIFPTRADSLGLRRLVYDDLWKFYFDNTDLEISDYASKAKKWVSDLEASGVEAGLAFRESDYNHSGKYDSFAGQIFHNGDKQIKNNWSSYLEGLRTLNKAILHQQCAPHRILKDVFKSISGFSDVDLFVRAAGVFLTKVAANNQMSGNITRSCTIAFADKTYTFGSSAG